jgi:hypothetical protein
MWPDPEAWMCHLCQSCCVQSHSDAATGSNGTVTSRWTDVSGDDAERRSAALAMRADERAADRARRERLCLDAYLPEPAETPS